jgi:pimeloyl-ACP methyl ester carboxylesterase
MEVVGLRARRVESSGGLPAPPGTLFPKDREVASPDGTPIRYTVRGRGAPTVVLCAGFACPDNHWRYLLPSLERHVRVVVWNYRGMGASGLPRAPGFRAMRLRREDFRLDRYAEDLEAVLDAEGIRRAVLLGHSMGTQVALEGYRRMPGRVAGLALVAGPYASPFHTMYGSDLGDRTCWRPPATRCRSRSRRRSTAWSCAGWPSGSRRGGPGRGADLRAAPG